MHQLFSHLYAKERISAFEVTRNIYSSIFLLDSFKERKETKQIKTLVFICSSPYTPFLKSLLKKLNYSQIDLHDHFDFNKAEFIHENFPKVILYFECYANANCNWIEKLNSYTRNEFGLCKASTILPLNVSITKFSIVIGSPQAYLSRLPCAITWVSNYRYPIYCFVIGYPCDS